MGSRPPLGSDSPPRPGRWSLRRPVAYAVALAGTAATVAALAWGASDAAGAVGAVALGATLVSAPFWLLRLAVLRAGASIAGAVGAAAAAGAVTALAVYVVRTDESSTAALILLPAPVAATVLGGAVLVVDVALRALLRRWRARRSG